VQRVISAALEAADPGRAVAKHWPETLDDGRPTRVIALGKGAPKMLAAALDRLGRPPLESIAVHPPGVEIPDGLEAATLVEADHPIPTERSLRAAGALTGVADRAGAAERLLVLVSGGGSALTSMPRPGIAFGSIVELTEALLRSGLTIDEMNTVRRECEVLKGGGLARRAAPAEVVGLILSDVIGDAIETVSSGPTATGGAEGLAQRASEIMRRADLVGRWPDIDAVLGSLADDPSAEAHNTVIGSNAMCVEAVAEMLRALGFRSVEFETGVTGACERRGPELGRSARTLGPASAIVWGGETTVTVGNAPGLGGRNQELALRAAAELEGADERLVLSFGTDGVDGPTDAAGAWADGATIGAMRSAGFDPARVLRDHDSYPALDAIGGLIRTGPTGTNLNDVMVAMNTSGLPG